VTTDQDLYYIGLSKVPGIGPVRMRRLLDYFGTAETAWYATHGDLIGAGLEGKISDALAEVRRTLNLDREMERIHAAGAKVLTWESEEYPERLREVVDSPPVLYTLGDFAPPDSWAVAVVGTRRATAYGREVTARLTSELAEAGVTIISGLARGIDSGAHNAALDSGGRTIAVLGSGVDVIYPPENRGLAQRIVAEGRGAVISEFPLGTQPDAVNFPSRNRIISGLSLGVLVVEAAERSGALITVTFALEQGRDVFAVPGPITSRSSDGPNHLLKQGAKCVTSARDILDELNMGMVAEHVEAVRSLPTDPTERKLLEYLQESTQHIDDLTNKSGLPASTVSAVLTMMELKGMVRHVGGMQYAAR
jgi:DNA processing protein